MVICIDNIVPEMKFGLLYYFLPFCFREAMSEWGEMVQPGIYMLQRSNLSDSKNPSEHGDDLNLLHHRIKEMQSIVTKLKESNVEIQQFMDQNDAGRGNIVSQQGVCDEHEELRSAILENDRIIYEKEQQLERLQSQVERQHCGRAVLEQQEPQLDVSDSPEIESAVHIDL